MIFVEEAGAIFDLYLIDKQQKLLMLIYQIKAKIITLLFLVPFVVVSISYFLRLIKCKDLTYPYVITFYISMVNR